MPITHRLSRRSFLAVPAAALLVRRHALAATAAAAMKDAYKDVFLIGTAFDIRRPDEFDAAELALVTSQFNVVTPENSMKPGPVHPEPDTWNWTQPDALLEFCAAHDMKTMGHCLVWHSQTGAWFFENATRDVALDRLRNHIHTIVGRYKGRISGWDVVNEAINDGGDASTGATENLRNSRWLQAIGPDYLEQAFKFAREADPNVPLHYNDYSIESGFKHQSSMQLLKRLVDSGAPITTVGIQGHWSVNALTPQRFEEIDRAIADYAGLGLKVAISELDVTLAGAGGGQLNQGRRGQPAAAGAAGGAQPGQGRRGQPGAPAGAGGRQAGRGRRGQPAAPPPPPTPEALEAQAAAYGKLFGIFVKHRNTIDRVTFWGVDDRRSWRSGQSPLPFDRETHPKPALDAILAAAPK